MNPIYNNPEWMQKTCAAVNGQIPDGFAYVLIVGSATGKNINFHVGGNTSKSMAFQIIKIVDDNSEVES